MLTRGGLIIQMSTEENNIQAELQKILSEIVIAGLSNNRDEFCHSRFLFRDTEKFYELWITDRTLDYPFLQDFENPEPRARLAEHERVGNFIYSINLLYFNSYCHLYRLVKNYLEPFRDNGVTPQSIIDVSFLLLPSDYMISLCSSLDVLSLLIAFIQGYPISVYASNMRHIMLLLEKIDGRENSIFKNKSSPIKSRDISNLSDGVRIMSQHLISELLPQIVTDEGINWLEEIYDYRNYFAHKNFTAKVIRENREVYLPKSPNILPSVIIDAEEDAVMNLCHSMNLYDFSIDRYKRTRELIEKTFQCLIQTYEWRLLNPDQIANPHDVFRKLNSYS